MTGSRRSSSCLEFWRSAPFLCRDARARRRLRRRSVPATASPRSATVTATHHQGPVRPLAERRGQVRRPARRADASAPDPPDFTKCVAAKRKTSPSPPRASRSPTDAQLKTQCKQEYDALRDQVLQFLISRKWIQGEAKKRRASRSPTSRGPEAVRAAEEAVVPEGGRLPEVPQDSGQTEADILFRVKLDVLSNKIREKVTKGKDKVTDAQIAAYYNKNKARFAQPERRDLRSC
jgi:foldase protein PrsA